MAHTKKENFEMINAILDTAEREGITISEDFTYDDLRTAIDNEIIALDKRTEQAKKRAAKKREEGDLLKDLVLNCIPTENFMSVDEILAATQEASEAPQELTRSKIISRLAKLGDKGTQQVIKEEITIETEGTKRKVIGYKRVD